MKFHWISFLFLGIKFLCTRKFQDKNRFDLHDDVTSTTTSIGDIGFTKMVIFIKEVRCWESDQQDIPHQGCIYEPGQRWVTIIWMQSLSFSFTISLLSSHHPQPSSYLPKWAPIISTRTVSFFHHHHCHGPEPRAVRFIIGCPTKHQQCCQFYVW